MNCSICRTPLERATLLVGEDGASDLRGFRCPRDGGVFLPSDLYFAWRERHAEGDTGFAPRPKDVVDVHKPKLCPQDGHIMLRHHLEPAASFWIDRCGVCGGVWFDPQEWEATVAAGLHEHLPLLVSDAWQREREAAASRHFHEERLRQALGNLDFERVETFRRWVERHEQAHLIWPRLRPDADGSAPEMDSAA